MTSATGWLARLAPSEQSLVGYLFWLSRPRFWLYLAGPVAVGVVYAADAPSEFVTPLSVALFGYFLVPANLFLYGVNDVFDRDIDAYNPKKDDEGREVRYEGGRVVPAIVMVAGALGLGFVPVLSRAGVVGLAGFFLLATQYSAPPLRLKTTPLLDSVSNGLYVLPGIVAYTALAGELPPAVAILGGWLWTMAMHTFSAIPDVAPDREAGIRTTATVLGERGALAYCGLVWLGAAAAMAVLHPALGLVFAIYPVFAAGVHAAGVPIERAYWWFPVVNTLAGMALTLGGIWRVVYV